MMTDLNQSDPVKRVERIFEDALKRSVDERPDFLETGCDGDAALRQRVEALLQAHADESGFLPGGDSLETMAGDGGVHEEMGRSYFVMELVKGIRITKYFEHEGTEITENGI
jgi:hypothetical protein